MENHQNTYVHLRPLEPSDALKLWQANQADLDWPIEFKNRDTFTTYVQDMSATALLGYGVLFGVWCNDELCGYASVGTIGSEHIDENLGGAMEAGTYLRPLSRGSGMNASIKHQVFEQVFEVYQQTWCVFTIVERNLRAIRAIEKLGYAFDRVDATTTNHAFAHFRKWKAWKTQTDCIVFALPVHKYR